MSQTLRYSKTELVQIVLPTYSSYPARASLAPRTMDKRERIRLF